MSFKQATGMYTTLVTASLLAMMVVPVTAFAENAKELSKEKKEEQKKEEKAEKSIEKADKAAEKDAEQAQARERSLPSHEDHHKLGSTKRVDKGFDFNTSNSK